MSHVKTAISLEQSLYEELVRIAHELQQSRSHVLAEALEEYLARRKSRDLLEQLNAAYDDGPDEEERAFMRFGQEQMRRILAEEDRREVRHDSAR